jgi:thiamine kinase-like enzyme
MGTAADSSGQLGDRSLRGVARLLGVDVQGLIQSPLSGGITNRNVRIDSSTAGGPWVVRIPGAETDLLGIDRSTEFAATVAAASVGVGPEVIGLVEPEGYLVTRFIDGRLMDEQTLRQAPTLSRVADSLRRVHDGPVIPGVFAPLAVAATYRRLAAEAGVPIPPACEEALGIARRIDRAQSARPDAPRPCHNDLLSANLIDDGQRIRIIDWEYAAMGDPLFDLGNLSANHDLTEAEDELLLEAYDGAADERRLARLTLMRVMSDLREAMWGVVQQGISSLEIDFAAYATTHFDRLLAVAGSDRFARALRIVGGRR